MSVGTFRVLTRILRFNANIQPCLLSHRIALRLKPNLIGTRCIRTELNRERESQVITESHKSIDPATVQEKLKEKKIIKSKDLQVNLPDFADTYPVLQTLVDLGVEIYKFNRDQSLCRFLLKLDFDNDIKPHLVFLNKIGVPGDRLAEFLTKNPYIIQCDFDDLNVRINYLESKKFTQEMIAHIITKNPKWLSYSVKDVDSRLGEVQQTLELSGDQMRSLITSFPGIVSVKKDTLKLNMFTIKEEFGITLQECQNLILKEPRLLRHSNQDLINTFHYLIYKMAVQIHLILTQPIVLKCRVFKLKYRHNFLQRLGRAQYNPNIPGYVSLSDLTRTTDEDFCQRVARSSLETYYSYQKTF